MKIPFPLPVYYDEHNETVNDKDHRVVYSCAYPSGLTYEQKKEKGEFLCKVMNGEVCIHEEDGVYAILDDSIEETVAELAASGTGSKSRNPWGRKGKPR